MDCICGAGIFIKYGKTSAGRQRYKCTECKRTFVNDKESYTKTEKRLLSMLIKFLDSGSGEDFNFKDFVKLSREEYQHGSGKIMIEKVYDSRRFDISKAKAVICKDGDKILIYEVKEDVLKDLEINRRGIKERPKESWRYEQRLNKKQNDNFDVVKPLKYLTNPPNRVINTYDNQAGKGIQND